MNEELIKKLIRLKVAEAELLIDILPSAASNMLKSFGRLVYEEAGALFHGEDKDVSKETSSDGVHHINID